jgi:hypothetical protein
MVYTQPCILSELIMGILYPPLVGYLLLRELPRLTTILDQSKATASLTAQLLPQQLPSHSRIQPYTMRNTRQLGSHPSDTLHVRVAMIFSRNSSVEILLRAKPTI